MSQITHESDRGRPLTPGMRRPHVGCNRFEFIAVRASVGMRIGTVIMMTGIIMAVAGFVAFTAMQGQPNSDVAVRIVKHGGAFAGLLGIGAGIAGALLYIINRQQVSV